MVKYYALFLIAIFEFAALSVIVEPRAIDTEVRLAWLGKPRLSFVLFFPDLLNAQIAYAESFFNRNR